MSSAGSDMPIGALLVVFLSLKDYRQVQSHLQVFLQGADSVVKSFDISRAGGALAVAQFWEVAEAGAGPAT